MEEDKIVKRKKGKTSEDKLVAIIYERERHDLIMELLGHGQPASHLKHLLDIIYTRLKKSNFKKGQNFFRINGIIHEHLEGLWEKM